MNKSKGISMVGPQVMMMNERKKLQKNAHSIELTYTTFKYIVWGYSHICGKTIKKSKRMINKVFREMMTSLLWEQQGVHREPLKFGKVVP